MPTSKTKTTGIASWPHEERPRERLLSKGPQALTDAELVAILIRVGFKGTNAVELARQLLKQFGSLRAMAETPVIGLLEVKGLKGAKAAQLIAAMEIARRVSVPAERGQLVMKSTTEAAEYLRERLRGLAEEQFRVLYLNRRNALLEDSLIAQGSVESVRPSLRNIAARALQVNASSLIAAHNHPSGVPDPSPDNVKKHEYATDHFQRLNHWLEKAKISTRYQFNMISPKSFNAFFQKLRDGGVVGFRSDLDVAMTKAAKTGNG